jgi:hypothetical protein
MVQEATDYYNKMTSIVPHTLLNIWTKAITFAESRRMSDLSAMDILGAQVVVTNPDPLPVLNDSTASAHQWLNLALSIEERQYVFHHCKILDP